MTVQFIPSRRAGKPVTWYVYAWRGGPLILKHIGPKKPSLKAADHLAIAEALQNDRRPKPGSFRACLRQWCPARRDEIGSAEWSALAQNTKRVWRQHVDIIEDRWGDMPIEIWNDPKMVSKVVKWRDERRATPRTADIGVTVLKHLLEFLRLNGRITRNVADRIPRLYKGANRAEIIWTDEDIRRFESKALELRRPQMIDVIRLAAATGLRREDLITLTWAQIDEFALVKQALKASRGKRQRVLIPMTPRLESVLHDLRTRDRRPGVETVLVNSLGRSWTKDSVSGSFGRIRDAAGIAHVDPDGTIRAKHLHDVRGTFATVLIIEGGLSNDDIARVMGWSPAHVANIRFVYVDRKREIVEMGKRILQNGVQNNGLAPHAFRQDR